MPTCPVKVYYFNTKNVINLIAVEFFTTTDILDEVLISIRDVLQDHGLPFGFVQAKVLYNPRLELKFMNVIALENKRQARSRGRGRGARAPPEIFRLELNSATKVEFFY